MTNLKSYSKLTLLTGCFFAFTTSAQAESYIIKPLSVQSAQQAYYASKITPQAAPIACANSVDFNGDYSLLFIRDQGQHNIGTTEVIVRLPDSFPKDEFDRENFYAYLMTNSSLDMPISAGNIDGTLSLTTQKKSEKSLHFLYQEGPQISVNFDRALSNTDYFVISTGFSTMLFDLSNLPDENIILADCQNSPNARKTQITQNKLSDHDDVINYISQQNNIESEKIQQASAAQDLPQQNTGAKMFKDDKSVKDNSSPQEHILADEAEMARHVASQAKASNSTGEADYTNPVVSLHDNGIYTVPAVRRSGPDGEIEPLDTRTKTASAQGTSENKATNISAGGIDIKNYDDMSENLFASSKTIKSKPERSKNGHRSDPADTELIDSLVLKVKILEIEKEAMRKKLVEKNQSSLFKSPDDIINKCDVDHNHYKKPSRWPFPFKKW